MAGFDFVEILQQFVVDRVARDLWQDVFKLSHQRIFGPFGFDQHDRFITAIEAGSERRPARFDLAKKRT